MKKGFLHLYDKLVLAHPLVTIFVTLTVIVVLAWQIPKFQLDASGDSLVLENDADLHFHRRITKRYGANEILVLTYSPRADLFSAEVLADIKELRDALRNISGVESVTTILDVPLLYSTNVKLADLADISEVKTLGNAGIDRETILAEFHRNPLYRGRLLSIDNRTTAILVNLKINAVYRELLQRRYELREKKYKNTLTAEEAGQLEEVSHEYRRHLTEVTHEEQRLVDEVRAVMDQHRGTADLYLGGVPMIVADMISYIRNDLVIFGLGVYLCLIFTLAVIFRKPRWVILPMFCCTVAVTCMMGYLGMVDWRVTVISSNFISLIIILTMSLAIHLIERYLEIHADTPARDQRTLVRETVRTIALPCIYTTLTTMIAFTSLVVSGIRPVIDFGMMMVIGLVLSFILAFVLFPATVVLLEKDSSGAGEDFSNPVTLVFARLIDHHGNKIITASILLALLSVFGIVRLRVDNRFIDYFRENTEIYQGMHLIDNKLGGTTPLDLVIDFPPPAEPLDEYTDDEDWMIKDSVSYWYADVATMERIEKIHDYLASLPETGEVLSLATAWKISRRLNGDLPLDNYELTLLIKKSPPAIKEMLIAPYATEDVRQTRFTMRIVESEKNLARGALLHRIRAYLTTDLGLDDSRIRFTNMYVLYNNMLESLFRSQILTIGMVFAGITVMFAILFRSVYLAAIAVIPNILPVTLVLGLMGWLNVSLDMMTITIASITIGISVDDTIHYIHRFQKEFRRTRNYLDTIYRCHRSIGRAMYYTSIAITIGFSILVFSSFIPTIYFGLFTGFAMMVALLADLLLLPQLLLLFKPLGREL